MYIKLFSTFMYIITIWPIEEVLENVLSLKLPLIKVTVFCPSDCEEIPAVYYFKGIYTQYHLKKILQLSQ